MVDGPFGPSLSVAAVRIGHKASGALTDSNETAESFYLAESRYDYNDYNESEIHHIRYSFVYSHLAGKIIY
jgi:hypothetical protein